MSVTTASQVSAQTIDGAHVRDLVAQAVAADSLAKQLHADAMRAVDRIAGDLIHELTEAQTAYFAEVDHSDELWAAVEIAEAALTPYSDLADDLERISHR
jgi:hypothetical protein